jgi:CRP-like cAMP-binding protein
MAALQFTDSMINSMRQCSLLKALDDQQFSAVMEGAHVRELQEHEMLFTQGDPLKDIFLVVSGGMKLYRLSRSGNEKVFDIIHPGQSFAEAALFAGSPCYPVNASALDSSIVVALDAPHFMRILRSSADLCISLMAQMSRRLHWMVNEIDRLTLHNASYRLIDYLLNETLNAEVGADICDVCLSAPKHVIASRLSMKPETFSRTLKHLVEEELIAVHDDHIELLDIEKMREIIFLELG